jgi:hypothetical protein
MRKRVPPQNVDLGDGASGHWVGNKNAKNVLIWIHGTFRLALLDL